MSAWYINTTLSYKEKISLKLILENTLRKFEMENIIYMMFWLTQLCNCFLFDLCHYARSIKHRHTIPTRVVIRTDTDIKTIKATLRFIHSSWISVIQPNHHIRFPLFNPVNDCAWRQPSVRNTLCVSLRMAAPLGSGNIHSSSSWMPVNFMILWMR